jgi:hypothetical protein
MLSDKSSFRLGHGFHTVMMHPDVTLKREAVLYHEKIFFDGREWQIMKSSYFPLPLALIIKVTTSP